MPADACYLGDGIALVRLRTGKKMYVDTRDIIVSPHLLLDGEWEKWVTEHIWRSLRPGDIFVDVGAHLGWYTLLASERVGPKGVVHAYEPNRSLLRLLENSLAINGLTNVRCHGEVVSDGVGRRIFRTSRDYAGWGHVPDPLVPEQKVMRTGYPETRDATTLDELEHAHCIKIDAEHHERQILAGARRLVARARPMLIVEHHPGVDPIEYVRLIEQRYTMSLIQHDSTLARLSPESLSQVGDGEMLCFAPVTV